MGSFGRCLALVSFLLALSACGDGADVPGSFDGSVGPSADAQEPSADFDHFGFEIAPTVPLQDRMFDVVATAYSSTDDNHKLTGYSGSISLTSSVGALSGTTTETLSGGKVSFQVSLDVSGSDIVLTATDDDVPAITGSSDPFLVSAPGDTATALQVVISEVNWFGNSSSASDEWIEIRNVSGSELNLSEWTLDGAGSSASPIVQLDNGTSLADGDYLVLGRQQGPDADGERTALTGLSNVQLHSIELGNAGEVLSLRDPVGTLIDQTPAGAWPAGDNTNDLSMERRDDITGGGYSDGTQADAWHSWSYLDVVQTTNADTSDRGTPGAANSNPQIFDHFGFDVQPTSPKANLDFTVTITAYSSTDDSTVITNYNGELSVAVSSGTLSGQIGNQPITNGVATLSLRDDTIATGVTLTATDSIYADLSDSSAPFDILPEGDPSTIRQVVINEVNYFGNDAATADEWIEIRNISGSSLNLADWSIDAAGSGADPITIGSGTILADGDYLILADRQGLDLAGERTSLTGVSGVQLASLSLSNGGEHLVLRDIDGTLIDETPDPGWPAGNATVDYSMERRDDITGGGYTDGAQDAAWYTWSSIDGTDTTNPDSSDSGTPGSANTNPDLFDHFSFVVTPTSPIVGTDFSLSVQAFASADDSVPLTAYSSSISVSEAVSGTLSGEATAQSISSGAASLTLQFDSTAPTIALTVTDDIYPEITGTTADFSIIDTGDNANARDVVISEVNWFGNSDSTNDEWVELRNISGASLDLSGWTIDGLGSGANAITIASNTILADGAFLLLGDRQGDDVDGSRTSLTGVANVQVQSVVALSNGGDPLTLRDIDGTIIDETPQGAWPAGDSNSDKSMERRDDITGGGYTDGSVAGAWYTWNVFGNTDTTSPDTSDHGTPGAANSDPAAFAPPSSLPYSTSFETSDPAFENLASGGFSTTPPTGTSPLTGVASATTDSVTTSFTGRELQSVDCLTLVDDTTTVNAAASAMASTANLGNVITARIKLLWFTDASCTTAHATTPNTTGSSLALSEGSYGAISLATAPPTGATHVKIRIEVHDNNGGSDGTIDDYAVDDVSVSQP